MPTTGRFLILLAVWCLVLVACTRQLEPVPAETDLPHCHIIYDAGSKRTRLYVYQLTDSGWKKHAGPTVSALADPVRAIRGKTMVDADAVVGEIISALEGIRVEGPLNKKGKPKWLGFDWRQKCDVKTVSVYATAGMRLAEQKNAADSVLLWNKLNQRLKAEVGMDVSTRTLSGFEEGLFTWLGIRESQDGDDFGVAEMGGASMQVTFPCSQCKTARRVNVKGYQVVVYSHSFLGWGQDEAWKKFGSSTSCERGAGKINPDWKLMDCSGGISVFEEALVETKQGIQSTKIENWYLSDAFRYMKDDDIERFCLKGEDSGFEPESSCFRAVYLSHVIDVLGLPATTRPSDVDWTLGAVVCTATRCLESE